ncbi:hypothetical protein HanHA300_Chr14g0521931 [Helianthus annuus]|nr:hypothetical protein HanHA300_Chr14g0521931 [Helianthus annuus]
MKQIENNSVKEKSRALAVIQDDEGSNWNDFLPEEEYGFNSALVAEVKQSAFVAVVNDKMKEEILKDKTYRERCIVGYRIEEMEKEYEEAKNYGRHDKKRECYVNGKGEPVVHPKEVVFNNVLAVIALSGEYYSNVAKDNDYVKKLDKIIRDVMTASLRQGDEERMKKNVESLVDDLKKVAEEEKVEGEKEEEAVDEEAVIENNKMKRI